MKTNLLTSETEGLTGDQEAQVRRQWRAMQHEAEVIDLPLSPFGDVLSGFRVHSQVWHPAKVSARYHASYLFFNNTRLFAGKRGLDMGTGTGIMGVVMTLYGATAVTLVDVSPPAIENARANVQHFQVADRVAVFHSNLFERVPRGQYDFLVFSQPFFAGTPQPGDTISASMLDASDLVGRFLEQAKSYLALGAIIMMPSYTLAGDQNSPVICGPRHGYRVRTTFIVQATQELQQGELMIHELSLM